MEFPEHPRLRTCDYFVGVLVVDGVTGWYGPGWWSVGTATTADLFKITADMLVAQALLETRLASVETESAAPEPVVDGGTP